MEKSVDGTGASHRQEEVEKASAELRQGVSKARAYTAEVKSRLGSRSFDAADNDSHDTSSTSRARAYAAHESERDS